VRVSDDSKSNLRKQWNDTVQVVIILLKGFVVACVAYFVSLGLSTIINKFGGESAQALKIFDEANAAVTYLIVVGKDLIEYGFK
jgi:hypothetical protein